MRAVLERQDSFSISMTADGHSPGVPAACPRTAHIAAVVSAIVAALRCVEIDEHRFPPAGTNEGEKVIRRGFGQRHPGADACAFVTFGRQRNHGLEKGGRKWTRKRNRCGTH